MRTIRVRSAILLALAAVCLTAFGTLFLLRGLLLRRDPTEQKLLEALSVIRGVYVGDWEEQALSDETVAAMVYSLRDPWSYYLPASQMDAYQNLQENAYDGIGVFVRPAGDGGILIDAVYRGSPAEAAGLQTDSLITAVGEQALLSLSAEEAMSALQKAVEAGGVIRLQVRRPTGETVWTELTPGRIERDPVRYELLSDGLGLITIENFEARCAEQAIEAVDSLAASGAEGLIFDVRLNPGGQLAELLELLDHLLPEGILFRSHTRAGEEQVETSDAACVALPMAVLISRDSYSAAEFFAAALSEYDWAVTVGEQTGGKGYAQMNYLLSDGSALHLSTLAYYTPKGINLSNVGVIPQLAVGMEPEQWAALAAGRLLPEDDPMLLAAAAELTGQSSTLSP